MAYYSAVPYVESLENYMGKNQTTKVALVRTNDRVAGVNKAIKLLNINPVKGKTVALKPNFNTDDPYPGSTHNDTLRTLILNLQKMGAKTITVADRSGPADTRQVMETKGIFKMAAELGFTAINLEETGPDGWVHIRQPGFHWVKGFDFARLYHEAECVVETCCLKTHGFGGHFTMSLKLTVGMVSRPNMQELHTSPHQRKLIAEMNTAYSPSLIVLDGIEAFINGGPMTGGKATANVILAGSIAIDATGVAVLRWLGTTPEVTRGPVFSQEQIARAVELGLGVSSPEQIEFLTGDRESAEFVKELKKILLKK
jgi:uncharacterized protein (DUF362 family)